jgi:hypothetical protein
MRSASRAAARKASSSAAARLKTQLKNAGATRDERRSAADHAAGGARARTVAVIREGVVHRSSNACARVQDSPKGSELGASQAAFGARGDAHG